MKKGEPYWYKVKYRCNAVRRNNKRCMKISEIKHDYFGDPEIYSLLKVCVHLCPEHSIEAGYIFI